VGVDWTDGAERGVADRLGVDCVSCGTDTLITDEDGVGVTSVGVLMTSDGKGGGGGKSVLVGCTRAFFFCLALTDCSTVSSSADELSPNLMTALKLQNQRRKRHM